MSEWKHKVFPALFLSIRSSDSAALPEGGGAEFTPHDGRQPFRSESLFPCSSRGREVRTKCSGNAICWKRTDGWMDRWTRGVADFTSVSLIDSTICLKAAAAAGGANRCVSMAVFRSGKSMFGKVYFPAILRLQAVSVKGCEVSCENYASLHFFFLQQSVNCSYNRPLNIGRACHLYGSCRP